MNAQCSGLTDESVYYESGATANLSPWHGHESDYRKAFGPNASGSRGGRTTSARAVLGVGVVSDERGLLGAAA